MRCELRFLPQLLPWVVVQLPSCQWRMRTMRLGQCKTFPRSLQSQRLLAPLCMSMLANHLRIPLDTSRVPVDLVTINAHKIHGPKGVGALYIRKGVVLEPMARGGSQEWNLRAGTSNVPGVVGFAEAVRLAQQSASLGGVSHMRALCTRLMRALQLRLGEDAIQLNGPPIGDGRLCSNLSLQFKGIEGDALLRYCARRGLCCSSASACHADVDVPSHVLLAIGCSTKQAKATLRLTTCRFTTETEIDHAADILADFRAQQQPLR